MDELAIGISFRDQTVIEQHEIEAAAAAFCGAERPRPMWEEAFDVDPQTPRDDLFVDFAGRPVRLTVTAAPTEHERAEAAEEHAIAVPINDTYKDLRTKGFAFEQMADANLDAMLNWKLGPLLDPDGFAEQLARRRGEVLDQMKHDLPMDSFGYYVALCQRQTVVDWLVERYPAVAQRSGEFRQYVELRSMPTLYYPAMLRAALAASPTRTAQPGDESDVRHLLLGLSRCDIATTDRSMAHMARTRQLVPSTCTLVSAREGAAGIMAALDARQAS